MKQNTMKGREGKGRRHHETKYERRLQVVRKECRRRRKSTSGKQGYRGTAGERKFRNYGDR